MKRRSTESSFWDISVERHRVCGLILNPSPTHPGIPDSAQRRPLGMQDRVTRKKGPDPWRARIAEGIQGRGDCGIRRFVRVLLRA